MYRHSANVGGREIIHIVQFSEFSALVQLFGGCIQCPTFYMEFTRYIYNNLLFKSSYYLLISGTETHQDKDIYFA